MSDVLNLVGVWGGFLLTLLVFSYLIGDTPLFRIAQAIFVGVTIGYAAVIVISTVLWQMLFAKLLDDPLLIVPLVLGLLLFTKLRAAWASFGNLPIAFLFGIGGALAIGGALQGILIPQLGATVVSFSPSQGSDALVNNLLLVVGTIGALLSFHFIVPQSRHVFVNVLHGISQGWGRIGRWFILVAFGATFAATAISRISILIDRVDFLLHTVGWR
jgi:hypothetical protein